MQGGAGQGVHMPKPLKQTNLTIIFTWIKGHANFEGNNVADTVSKWISSHIHIPANQLSPPDSPTILYHNTPLPGKITAKHTKLLHEAHTHTTTSTSRLAPPFFSPPHGSPD